MTKALTPRVMVVSDDMDWSQRVSRELTARRFEASFTTSSEAVGGFATFLPDVVILGAFQEGVWELVEFIETLGDLRTAGIIVVRACGIPKRRIEALDAGADDFMESPFSVNELGARILAVMRRIARKPQGTVRSGPYEIDLVKRIVARDGQAVRLSRQRWLLLMALASRPGAIIPNVALGRAAWGVEYDENNVRVLVSNLRKQLPGIRIETHLGLGYQFVTEGDAS